MNIPYIRGLCAAVLLSFNLLGAQAGVNLSDPLPISPQVTIGTLANGLTYYIQKNSRPEKRLELRLVVKAGSILEDEDQQGLAHFTEHMAFNGSTHFKKHELVSYLQSIGLKFGADLNAYTSFNETVYILPIPTDKLESIEKGFLVLQDWAQGVSFNDADIDMERAIVLEELRLGKGAQDRMNKVLLPKIFSGSQYAKRLPIGTEASLKGFRHDAIKRFYKDWYRPNLMAVIVVGDIEVAAAKALVESHFAALKNPDNERERIYPSIPARAGSEAVVITDKEATNNALTIHYPVQAAPAVITLGDYRHVMVERLFGAMLGQRMQELTQKANPPFVGGGSGVGRLVPGFRVFQSIARLGRQGSGPAVDALVQESERARQFGFGEAELERAKKDLLRKVESAHAERETTDSARYANEYLRNFLERESIPGIDNELAYTRELLPTIGLVDVNAFAQAVIPEKASKLAIYAGSDKPDSGTPTEQQLLSSISQAEQRTVAARTEKAVATSLMARLPQGGRIVAERQNALLGLTEWDLSNGVKVILKPTDFKNDEIVMSARRHGGQSRYDLADQFNAAYASQVVGSMGVSDFTPINLQRMLAGKRVGAGAWLDRFSDVVTAGSSTADLETMLQLVSLRFSEPRNDPDLFRSFQTRSQDAVKNNQARPEVVLNDAVQSIVFNNHPRALRSARAEDFEQITLARTREIYRERFSSAKGFTFILVGSFTPEAIKPLIATYLGSLPTSDLSNAYRDMGIRPVTGVVQKAVYAGTEAKSIVALRFAGDANYSEDEQARARALADVLNIRIVDVLREKLTLIYSASVSGRLTRVPYHSYEFSLMLPCSPDNVEQVIAAVFGEIDKLQKSGPDAADLAKVKQNWLVANRKSVRENSYWLGELQMADLYGTDHARILDFEKRAEAITVNDVQAAAKRYLRRDNYVQVVLYPEKK
jgi:zinc protease